MWEQTKNEQVLSVELDMVAEDEERDICYHGRIYHHERECVCVCVCQYMFIEPQWAKNRKQEESENCYCHPKIYNHLWDRQKKEAKTLRNNQLGSVRDVYEKKWTKANKMCGSELKQTLKERKTKPAKSLMNIIKTKEKGRKKHAHNLSWHNSKSAENILGWNRKT